MSRSQLKRESRIVANLGAVLLAPSKKLNNIEIILSYLNSVFDYDSLVQTIIVIGRVALW